ISSNANRFYTALESAYGQVAPVTSGNRIRALKLMVQQQLEKAERKDKTGTRTFGGLPWGGRRRTTYELRTYLTTWQPSNGNPGYGAMFQAAWGGAPRSFAGGPIAGVTSGGQLDFASDHGLVAGQAVACNGEIRFVSSVVDSNSVQLNAPFANVPLAGS